MRAYNLYSVVHATRVLPTRTESYPAHPAMPPASYGRIAHQINGDTLPDEGCLGPL